MIGRDAALQFAAEHFPAAPEKLVELLGIDVRDSLATGADGWCLTWQGRSIIRLSNRLGVTQRRFTLAHEISHLILGIPAAFGETFEQMIASDREEEREVNELASALLMPHGELQRAFSDPPVVAAALKRFANLARVSQLSAALRVCNSIEALGLNNASVVSFAAEELRWQWSTTLTMSQATAFELLKNARVCHPHAFRDDFDDEQTVVASVLDNPFFGTATLFVQLLPRHLGENLSPDELRRRFEEEFVNPDPKFRATLQGIFGAFKPKCYGMTADAAVELFWEKNEQRLGSTVIGSEEGRLYVRRRISQFVL